MGAKTSYKIRGYLKILGATAQNSVVHFVRRCTT